MEFFSEVYGCYYQVVADILRAAPLTRRQVEALVGERGYGESTLQLVPKLLDQNAWPLLEEREGLLFSLLEHPPALPVTALERSWLKALLGDPRIRLFLTDAQLDHLAEALRDVTPLYRQEDFLYFDRYLDGDDYADPDYRRRFQAILATCAWPTRRPRAACGWATTGPCAWNTPPRTINFGFTPPRRGAGPSRATIS